MPEEITVREARPSDNEGLIELNRSAPMMSPIGTFFVDRAPDFFALNRARGETIRTFVADLEGRPVGYFCYAVLDLRLAGGPVRVASFHDFRVDPTLRRRKVGTKVVSAVFGQAAKDGVDYLYGMIARGNVKGTSFLGGGPGWPELNLGGMYCNFAVRPRRRPPKTRYRIETAREEDIPEIVDLLNHHYRDHNFAVRFTADTFRAMLSASLDYGIDDFFVAREGGEMVAVAGLWDQGRSKKIVLLELHPVLAVLFRLAALVIRLLHIPLKVPRIGEPISSLYIRHGAVREGKKDAFRDLVHWISARIGRRPEGKRLIFAAAHEKDDRLWKRSTVRQGSKFHLFYQAFREITDAEKKALAQNPFYDDFSLS